MINYYSYLSVTDCSHVLRVYKDVAWLDSCISDQLIQINL